MLFSMALYEMKRGVTQRSQSVTPQNIVIWEEDESTLQTEFQSLKCIHYAECIMRILLHFRRTFFWINYINITKYSYTQISMIIEIIIRTFKE